MFDHPQIISPEDHPKDCVVFVDRAKTVSEFLRAADELVLNGEHRIICWRPPHGNDIVKMAREESGSGTFDIINDRIHSMFFDRINLHIDDACGFRPSGHIILNGTPFHLTQTVSGQGTPLFFLPTDAPGRKDFYEHVSETLDAYEYDLDEYGVKNSLRGPFSLAARNVALILPLQFNSQATLHGFPVRKSPEDTRQTTIATLRPTGLR